MSQSEDVGDLDQTLTGGENDTFSHSEFSHQDKLILKENSGQLKQKSGQSESPKSTKGENRSLSKPLSCTIEKARKQTRRKESKEAPRRTMMKKAKNTSRRI